MNSTPVLAARRSGNLGKNTTIVRFCFLAGILFLAGALRGNHISQPLVDPLSFRETSTAMMAENFSHGHWNIFLPQVNWTGPGPGYTGREFQTFTYLVAIVWYLVGQHDWIGRALAIFFGLTSLAALYLLVRRIWGESYGLASAAVWALLPGAIIIDRSFLPEAVMLGLVLTSLLCYVIFLQTKRSRCLYLAAVLGVLGILTKLPGAIVIAPIVYATVALASGKGASKSLSRFRIILVAGLSLLPVIAYYLWTIHVANVYPPYHLAGMGNFIWSKQNVDWFSSHFFIRQAFFRLKDWLWGWSAIILALIGLVESFSALKRGAAAGEVSVPWLFHWWIVGCVVLYTVAAYELVRNSWNFHVFNVLAAVFAGRALIAIGRMPWFGKSPPMLLLKVSVPLITLAWSSIMILQHFWNVRPTSIDDYRLGEALSRISEPGDLVATIPSEMWNPRVIYYSHRRGWVFPGPYLDWSRLPPGDGISIRAFEELRLQNARWFAVARQPLDQQKPPRNFWEYHRELVEYVQKTCTPAASGSYGAIYRIPTPEELARKQNN